MPYNTLGWNRIRYSMYAPIYDGVAWVLSQGRKQAIEALDLQPHEHVLIVGAGTGLDLEVLQPGQTITAMDVSPAMLRRLVHRAQRLDHNVNVYCGDAERIALPTGSVDCVLLHCIVAVVPNPEACIQEAARVVKPGGRISIFDKFVPAGQHPTFFRRMMNQLTETGFSSITRQLEPLLETASLQVVAHRPAAINGVFTATIAQPTT